MNLTMFIRMLMHHKMLIVIIFLAVVLRFYDISSTPISLNHDETALGYNAFSLLKTGADEHGVFLPLSLKSFGDWKLPVYPAITILPVLLFGLTEFAVRFPSAVAGVLGVILTYFLTVKMFKNNSLALIASTLYAVSPWGIYFSRIAYETNVATTIFLLGLYLFLFYQERKSAKHLIGSAVCFGLTLFTYHAFIIFMPLFVLACIVLYRDRLSFNRATIVSAIIFFFFITASIASTLQGSAQKVSAISIFTDKDVLYRRVEKLRGDDAVKNQTVEKLLHNKFTGTPYEIMQNYVSAISPSFLFDKGGEKLLHTTGEFGNLYVVDALFLLVGIAALFWNREKQWRLLSAWFAIGLIPSAITTDAPSSTRLFIVMPIFTIIGAYGAYTLLRYFFRRSVFSRLGGLLLISAYLLNVIYFLDIYFIHMNYHRARFLHYGFKQLATLTARYPEYKVIMKGPENFPYISFLFYEQYNPRLFQNDVVYYPPTSEGLQFVKQFGRYTFVEKIDNTVFHNRTIYIDDPSPSHGKNVIRLPSGEAIFGYTIVR